MSTGGQPYNWSSLFKTSVEHANLNNIIQCTRQQQQHPTPTHKMQLLFLFIDVLTECEETVVVFVTSVKLNWILTDFYLTGSKYWSELLLNVWHSHTIHISLGLSKFMSWCWHHKTQRLVWKWIHRHAHSTCNNLWHCKNKINDNPIISFIHTYIHK